MRTEIRPAPESEDCALINMYKKLEGALTLAKYPV